MIPQVGTEGRSCQIHDLPFMAEPMHLLKKIWQRGVRMRRIFKRGMSFLTNILSSVVTPATPLSTITPTLVGSLQAGDWVRVRSREEVRATLDLRDRLHRCGFMEEMWPYCGTIRRVLKRVGIFLDERDYRRKKVNGIVLLEGAICEGTNDYGRCDRACYFFWREEWLEKIERKENDA